MSLSECREVLLLMTKKLERDVSDGEEAQIEAHLNGCCSCRLAYASAREALDEINRGSMAPLNGNGRMAQCKENRHVEN